MSSESPQRSGRDFSRNDMPMSKGVKSQDNQVKIHRVIKRLNRQIGTAPNSQCSECTVFEQTLAIGMPANAAGHRDIGGCYRTYYWR